MTQEKCRAVPGKRVRRVVATATAFTFLCHNFAWAVCADGSTLPAGGFVAGSPPVTIWSPGLSGDGSVFVPDISVFEHNNPGEPRTGGGHNWVFDVNTFCKAIDVGPAGGVLWPVRARPRRFRHYWSGRDHHADLRSDPAESGRRAQSGQHKA